MPAGRQGDPEDRERSEFHETEYYSKFQEQDGSIPPDPSATPVPTPQSHSPKPSDAIDEKTIQELMDAALREGAGVRPEEPENLDTTIRADWRAPVLPQKRRDAQARREERLATPRPAVSRPTAKGPKQKRTRKAHHRRLFSRSRLARFAKSAVILLLLGAVAGGVYYYEFIREESVGVLRKRGAEDHKAGNFVGALQQYDLIRKLSRNSSPRDQAELAFLMAGAYEGLWQKSQSPKDFDAAIEHFDLSVQIDPTPLKVFAAESVLAKSDLYDSIASQTAGATSEFEQKSREALDELILSPAYQASPIVTQGVPHRRLASMIEQEDPRRAISLLIQARDNQGHLEEGAENLRIAQIYRDELGETEPAVEYFELVKQNELSSEDHRAVAHAALLLLRQGDLTEPELIPNGLLDLPKEEEIE